jgi:hypothetical protein
MKRISLFACGAVALAALIWIYEVKWNADELKTNKVKFYQTEIQSMTTTSAIVTDINNFITQQNQNRGIALAGGGTSPLDYNALTGTAVAGENAVTGISTITAGAPVIALPSSQVGNAVIFDGGVSTSASTSGPDSYSFVVGTNGTVTVTDNNTGNSQSITGASYLVFDGAATTSTGAYQSTYLVETGTNAQIAEMYNAAFGRVPDFAGLEYYAIPIANGSLTLHQAATYFLASPEFAKLYPALAAPADNGGPNDQAFINDLYGQILHRTPTAAEVAYYVNALQNVAGTDRAQLLIYFSISPENQQDVSSWLINPANGAVNQGALTASAATAVLTSEISSGTISASAFATMSSSAQVAVTTSSGYAEVIGANYLVNGQTEAFPVVGTSIAHLTINLSTEYYAAAIEGVGDTVNGASTGGSIVQAADNAPYAANGAALNDGGTVNLFGNANWIATGNLLYGGITTPTVVNGWNSTDYITRSGAPLSAQALASLPAGATQTAVAGTVYQPSAASPLSGASLGALHNGAGFSPSYDFAVNVGGIANDSTATMVAAANAVYKVGDVAAEHAFFFGQDPQGNTMVFFWRGDSTHAGSILASDMSGAVELVGVQASSLTGANFH